MTPLLLPPHRLSGPKDSEVWRKKRRMRVTSFWISQPMALTN